MNADERTMARSTGDGVTGNVRYANGRAHRG